MRVNGKERLEFFDFLEVLRLGFVFLRVRLERTGVVTERVVHPSEKLF